VLLHQFHDILPGSSIAWVHREAEATYASVRDELEKLIAASIGLLAGSGSTLFAFDAAPQALASYVHTDPLPAAPTRQGTDLVLDNGLLRAVIDEQGLVTSVVDLRSGREVLAEGHPANLLQLHPDLPNAWDAWDIDAFYRNRCADLTMASEVAVRDGVFVVARRFGSSVIKQRIGLTQGNARLDFETEVDWREVESILKVAFPLALHADRCACEIQFGHVMRPTHVNTSWRRPSSRSARIASSTSPSRASGWRWSTTPPTATMCAVTASSPPSGCRCCALRASPIPLPTKGCTASGMRSRRGPG
jgi:alpha-mannosidase